MVEIALQKARCVCFLFASVGGLVSCPQSSLLKALCKKKVLDNPRPPSRSFSLKFFQFFLQKVLSKSCFSKVLKPPLLQNLFLHQVGDMR